MCCHPEVARVARMLLSSCVWLVHAHAPSPGRTQLLPTLHCEWRPHQVVVCMCWVAPANTHRHVCARCGACDCVLGDACQVSGPTLYHSVGPPGSSGEASGCGFVDRWLVGVGRAGRNQHPTPPHGAHAHYRGLCDCLLGCEQAGGAITHTHGRGASCGCAGGHARKLPPGGGG